MPLSRRSLIFRRAVLAITVVCALPLVYSSAFVSAAFLFGAGLIPGPAYGLLCDSVFAPIYWADGDSGRLESLVGMAGDAYWCGLELRR